MLAPANTRWDPTLDLRALRRGDWIAFWVDPLISRMGEVLHAFHRWDDFVSDADWVRVRYVIGGTMIEHTVWSYNVLRRVPAPGHPPVAASVPLTLAPTLPEPFTQHYFVQEVADFLALPAAMPTSRRRLALRALVVVYANVPEAAQVATAHLWEHPPLRDGLRDLGELAARST